MNRRPAAVVQQRQERRRRRHLAREPRIEGAKCNHDGCWNADIKRPGTAVGAVAEDAQCTLRRRRIRHGAWPGHKLARPFNQRRQKVDGDTPSPLPRSAASCLDGCYTCILRLVGSHEISV